MKISRATALFLALSNGVFAAGERYPVAFIDRPLVLPAGTVQPQFGWEVLGSRGLNATRNSLLGAVEAGVAPGFQIGASVVLTEDPSLGFDRAAARAQFNVHPLVAARLDAAVYRFLGVSPTEYGYASGIGLSIKVPVVPGTLALISGRAFALPPIGRTEELAFSDDLFTLDLNHSNVTASVGLPVGILLQPLEPLALAFRAAYRHGFGGGQYSENWIPIGFDVLLNLLPAVDVIASAELPGNVNSYTDWYVLRGVLQGRF